jgi:hypothetical protein
VDRLKRFRRRDRATACPPAAAIQLKQLAAEAGTEVSVVVVEKGSEVGAHILSSPRVPAAPSRLSLCLVLVHI